MDNWLSLFKSFKNSIDNVEVNQSLNLANQLCANSDITIEQITDIYFVKNPIIVKNLNELETEPELVKSLGLSIHFLRCNFTDEWAHEHLMSNQRFSAGRYQYIFPQKKGSPPLYNTYIYAALEQGLINSICPYSGEKLGTSISFPIFIDNKWTHIVFYLFTGSKEPYYVGTAGYAGQKSFVYLPQYNLVIGSPAFFQLGYTKAHLVSGIIELYKKILLYREKMMNYLQNPARKLALIYGLQTNLGHFLTNEYSGFQRIAWTGLYRKVKNVIIYKNKKIPLELLFPEFKEETYYTCDSEDQLFETCLTQGLFVLYPCASHLSAEAAYRVQQTASKCCSESQKELLADCVADPLIFINLRKHNKAWQEQAEGIINLARAVKLSYPDVGFFLDGLSDCQEDVQHISDSLQNETVIYNGIDISLFDTICWACRSDAYLCVIGSGLVLLTCIANKPGIVHSEYAHMGQVRPGGYWSGLRNDIFAPLLVSPEEITILKEQSLHLPAIYKNYSMAWQSLYTRLMKILYPPIMNEDH